MLRNFSRGDRFARLSVQALIVAIGLAAHESRGGTVDLQPFVNANLRDTTFYFMGSNFPPGGTTLTNAGVSFTLANGPGGAAGTGTAQTYYVNGSTPASVDISVNIANPVIVDTLINSTTGTFGDTVGSVEFKATGGLDYSVDLVEGQNIRDYNNDGFNNTIGLGTLGAMYVHTFSYGNGQSRFDEQQFILPASFNTATLTDIILHGPSANATANGLPFLAAATVATVPEPSSLLLMSLAAGMIAGWRWR